MKKIYILISFIFISVFSFATFNDNLNLISEDGKKNIEGKINEIEKEKNISLFLNTLLIGEGFTVRDPEHTVIFNLKKEEKGNKFETELSFSKDIDIEEKNSEIEDIFSNSEEILESGEYEEYLLAILDGIQTFLKDIKIETLNQMVLTKEQNENNFNVSYVILTIFILILVFISYKIKILRIKNKNK